jgi:MFS family permease
VQARTFVMFLAGAVIGFLVVWYYVDLFGLFDYRSSRAFGLAVGAAGALLLGIISAFFIRAVAIFAAATVIGYVVVVFGWIAYAHIFDIADREGGKGMGMIFIVGPAAGAIIGLIAASLLSRRGMPNDGPAPPATLVRG